MSVVKKETCEWCIHGDKSLEDSRVCCSCLLGKKNGFKKAKPKILKERGLVL